MRRSAARDGGHDPLARHHQHERRGGGEDAGEGRGHPHAPVEPVVAPGADAEHAADQADDEELDHREPHRVVVVRHPPEDDDVRREEEGAQQRQHLAPPEAVWRAEVAASGTEVSRTSPATARPAPTSAASRGRRRMRTASMSGTMTTSR